MTENLSVTIAIPAYNESRNIGALLDSIIKQNCKGFYLKEILVSSDGSTDDTVKICKDANISNLIVFEHKDRKGQAVRQNEMFTASDSDIVVLLNADILITDPYFISKLIKPIADESYDLTSAGLQAAKPGTLIEKILYQGTYIKESVFELYKNGNNVYTCHGPARAFSKKFYKNINFKSAIGEDAYSYLYCITNDYKYKYVKEATVLFKLPSNIDDHKSQSLKYFKSILLMEKEFGKKEVKNFYKIDLLSIIKGSYLAMLKSPLHSILYIILVAYMRVKSKFVSYPNLPEISVSSKYIKSNI